MTTRRLSTKECRLVALALAEKAEADAARAKAEHNPLFVQQADAARDLADVFFDAQYSVVEVECEQ